MTHLNIQQGQNIEVVTTQIIKKLYDTALTVSEPLEGETDAAYMSGNLQTNKASRKVCTYLTTRFPNLHITVQDYYIDFEDPALEQLLITKGVSSDGVGVTESDAASATLNGVFYSNSQGNTDVTKFNEFTKFTQVKTNIPNNLFRNCSNLEEINLSGTTTIGESSFRSSGVKDINIPMLQSLGKEAFRQCTNLTTINFPSLTSLTGDNVFYECSNLTTVTSLGSITSLPKELFYRCSSLSSIPLDNITSIQESVFTGCNSLTRIILPSIETIERYAFNTYNGIQRVIDLGSSLTQINQSQFKNDDSSIIIIRSNSVPTMTNYGNSPFYNAQWWNTTIYVPRDLINSYKADTDGWGRISGKNGREVFYALEDSIYANTNWYSQS